MLTYVKLRFGLHWHKHPLCHMTNFSLAVIGIILVLTTPIAVIEYTKYLKQYIPMADAKIAQKEEERLVYEVALIRCLNEQIVTDYKDEAGRRNLVMCKGVRSFEGRD